MSKAYSVFARTDMESNHGIGFTANWFEFKNVQEQQLFMMFMYGMPKAIHQVAKTGSVSHGPVLMPNIVFVLVLISFK